MTDADIAAIEDDVVSEDSFAEFYGTGLLSLAGHRQRRNLGLLSGWPKRLLLLNIPDRAEAVLKQFRIDYQNRLIVQGLSEEMTKGGKEVMDRHILLKTSNEQHILIATGNGWKTTSEQAKVTKVHTSGRLQTQIVEDMIGAQKNDPSTRAHNRFKRPLPTPYYSKLTGVLHIFLFSFFVSFV